jgi:hypothetical protein
MSCSFLMITACSFAVVFSDRVPLHAAYDTYV